MKRLVLVVVTIFFCVFIGWVLSHADDKSTLELKQMALQVIEARQGQIQAQSQLLQITFSELEKQKAVVKDEIRLLEERIKKAEGEKKK